MSSITCLAHDDPARIYNYCPAISAAIIFAILFSIVTLSNSVQSFILRHRPAWVLIMAGLWEIGGYVCRCVSIYHQASSGIYTAQFLLILLAPLWINAYVYMVFGRMIHFFLINDRIFGIRARRITMVFVLFDITAFVVQLVGGIMTSGTDVPVNTVQLGLHIYTGGVALQLAFIATFICLTLRFQHLLQRQGLSQSKNINSYETDASSVAFTLVANTTVLPTADDARDEMLDRTYEQARALLRVTWVALSLIVLRNIFRLVEYGLGGVNGNVTTRNEWFQYVFDAVPMFFVIITLSVYHPGKVLKGYRSDFSEEDKARNAEKKAKKAERKELKKDKKQQKVNEKASKAEAKEKDRLIASVTDSNEMV